MATEIKRQINSLVVRWDNQGNYKGASVTNLVEVFEDGELIATSETNPIEVSLDDLANQQEVADIISRVQVDQAAIIVKKTAEIETIKEEKAALKVERDALKVEIETVTTQRAALNTK